MEHLFFFLLQDIPAKLFFISNFFEVDKVVHAIKFYPKSDWSCQYSHELCSDQKEGWGCVSMNLSQCSMRHRDEKISVKVFKWLTLRTNKNKK